MRGRPGSPSEPSGGHLEARMAVDLDRLFALPTKIERRPRRRPEQLGESEILKATLTALNKLPGVHAERNQTGAYQMRGHWVRFGWGPGSPDIVGCFGPAARLFAIEVKRPGERPTERQIWWLMRIASWGGIAGWADSSRVAVDLIRAAMDPTVTSPEGYRVFF